MNTAEFTDLATDLAVELGRLRSETWTATADERYEFGATLAGGIARLRVSWSSRERKLAVTGLGPDGISRTGLRKVWHINVSPDRGLPTVARDVNRRILGAGYADDLLVARECQAEHDALESRRAAWLAQAAGLFGIEPGADGKVYLQQFVKGSGYVQNYGWSAEHADMLDISLSGIPAQVALDMLAVLAKHAARACRCCRVYGPGHHPRLAVTGCLRERSGRGEAASSNRVVALLAGRGVPADDADAALTEARTGCYQVSEIYDGDRLLAVVSWDTAGLGEFTVELSRSTS